MQNDVLGFYYNDVQQEDVDKGLVDVLTKLLEENNISVLDHNYDEENEQLKFDVINNDKTRKPGDLMVLKTDIKYEAYDKIGSTW